MGFWTELCFMRGFNGVGDQDEAGDFERDFL